MFATGGVGASFFEDVPLVEFMNYAFARSRPLTNLTPYR